MKTKIFQTVQKYFDGFTALFYPSFCVICNKEMNEQNNHFCFICEQDLDFTYFEKYKSKTIADELFWGRLDIENVYSMLYFSRGNSTQKILHHIKYKQGRELAIYMGEMMGMKMKINPKFSSIDALIPIPLHSKKSFLRGYNQSFLIAKGITKVLDIEIVDALYRKTHDVSQTKKKNKEERYQNIKGKFALKEGKLADKKHVLIIDDVLTTGSTLEFSSRAVFTTPDPIKISLATIAIAY